MNFPAIAKKTFDRFKDNLAYISITKRILAMLRNMLRPNDRAHYLHQQVDVYLRPVLNNPVAKDRIACGKGCSLCCHTQVSITGDEAELLADKIISGDIEINFELLRKQAKVKNDSDLWYKLSHQERQCVFLNKDKLCSVYNDRPKVCHTNMALDTSKQCSTEDGKEKPIRMLITEEADMALMAGYIHAKSNGALPYMLAKALSKRKI
jgi:Fe-S-cluster containining protein